MTQTVIPDQSEHGTRLDIWLTQKFPKNSRTHWQTMIKKGLITVNGKPATKHVHVTDKPIEIQEDSFVKEEQKSTYPTQQPRIIAETDDYIVVYKPIDWIAHRQEIETPFDPKLYIADWAKTQYPEIATVGDEPEFRNGMVHRLDRPVSGIMVIARTQNGYEWLKQQFTDRTVHKTYTTLIHGVPNKDEGSITFGIVKKAYGHFAAVPTVEVEKGNAQSAETLFTVISRWNHHALLEVNPITGRTHQIRVHLFALNMPIVGERKYGHAKPKHELETPRVLLQATSISFPLPDGTKAEYNIPLDTDFQKVIKNLGEPR